MRLLGGGWLGCRRIKEGRCKIDDVVYIGKVYTLYGMALIGASLVGDFL